MGICARCHSPQSHRGSCSNAIRAVADLLPRYRNEPIIEKREQPRFDWKDGLTGESTPDRVVVPAVEAVDLWELICELTGREVGDDQRQPFRAGTASSPLFHPLSLEKKRR